VKSQSRPETTTIAIAANTADNALTPDRTGMAVLP
jgi:hypothetical protein